MGQRRGVSFGPRDRGAGPSERPAKGHKDNAVMPAEPMQDQANATRRNGPSRNPDQHTINEALIARWTRRLGIFTGLLAAVTALLVVATGISAYFLYTTDDAVHKTLLNGQRAFVHLEKISFGVVEKWTSDNECNDELCVFNPPRKVGRVVRTEFSFTNSNWISMQYSFSPSR
jgi:hypothetical protein